MPSNNSNKFNFKRSFRVISVDGRNKKKFGFFVLKDNQEPLIAAARAFRAICDKYKLKDKECDLSFTFKEHTRSARNRDDICYKVHGKKVKLDKPKTETHVGKNGKIIKVISKYTSVVKMENISKSKCESSNKQKGGKTAKRNFTLVDFPKEGSTYGHYSGSNPRRAASKAFTRLAKLYNFKNSTDEYNYIQFTIREITRNSANKEYTYHGTRVKLYKPTVVNHNGKKIKYYYKNIITNSRDV